MFIENSSINCQKFLVIDLVKSVAVKQIQNATTFANNHLSSFLTKLTPKICTCIEWCFLLYNFKDLFLCHSRSIKRVIPHKDFIVLSAGCMKPILTTCTSNPQHLTTFFCQWVPKTTIASKLTLLFQTVYWMLFTIEPECCCCCHDCFKILNFLFLWCNLAFKTIHVFFKNLLLEMISPL